MIATAIVVVVVEVVVGAVGVLGAVGVVGFVSVVGVVCVVNFVDSVRIVVPSCNGKWPRTVPPGTEKPSATVGTGKYPCTTPSSQEKCFEKRQRKRRTQNEYTCTRTKVRKPTHAHIRR